ncbi:amino acid adenylation domain-containing protein [Streptomyces solisilvae]|uniref:non-ribosomal peptide synthetase n=1 Tax=Streptomyces malaysiensis TaxID=92644 RepID=UPI00332C34E7
MASMEATGGTTRKEQALWLLEQLVPDKGVNNLSLAFRVNGALRQDALARTLATLVRRHEVLRTSYRAEPTRLGKKILEPDDVRIDVERRNTSPERIQQDLTAFVSASFPLDGGILVRAAHFESPGGDYFCLVAHHLVFDTISAGILAEELVLGYDAFAAGVTPIELLAPVPVMPAEEPNDGSLAFWREHLRDFEPKGLELWCGEPDVPRPTLAGDHVTLELAPQAREAVRRMARELRAPEAVVLYAAYYLLLAAHGAGPDMVVGSPVNVRGPQHQRAIGYHVNVLPVRVKVDFAEGFGQLVLRTRDTFFEAISHANVSVDILSAELNRVGSAWRDTLFRHLFNYVPDMGLRAFKIDGMTADPVVVENAYSKFDLEFFVMSSPESIRLRAVHYTEVLSTENVELLLRRYEALLLAVAGAADRPVGEFRIWSPEDHEVIEAANRTARPEQPATVLDAIRRHVASAPDSIVVEHGDRRSTYRQVWDAAVSTRRALADGGVRPGDVVAIAAPRGAELVAAVLGVWLAGAAYLPLDLTHPAERLAYQLADSGATAVLAAPGDRLPDSATGTRIQLAAVGGTATAGDPEVEDGTDAEDGPVLAPRPEDRAYLIYTSGSTGRPKGTLITHRGLANVAAHFAEELAVTPADRMLWITTFAFDMCGLELYMPLVAGARMVVGPDHARTDGRALAAVLDRHEIGILQATPTTWRLVLDDIADRIAGRRVICGGEPVPVALARRLVDIGCQVHHLYGPTETTIWSTSSRLVEAPGPTLDVGRPIRNTRVFITAPDGRELPIGVRGDLCIAGSGVAIGYHNRPELTASAFGEHPAHGAYYRTGDMARWRRDGSLELLGRVDRQIKLRGNRIELAEVEAVLLTHPDVTAAAVVVSGDPGSDGLLVAFVETADGTGAADRLWEHARSQLPHSAVPQDFVVLDALPRNANQKVDYPALARTADERRATTGGGAAAAADDEGEAPADDTTTGVLLALWRDLLGRHDLTPRSNFFAHGGHSLLGAQLVQRIEQATGVRATLSELFGNPTPEQLAVWLRDR